MTKDRIMWINIAKGFGLFTIIAAVALVIAFVSNYVGGKKELEQWNVESYGYASCPFPLRYRNHLPPPYDARAARMIKEINDLTVKLGYGPMYSDSKGKIVIDLKAAPPRMRKFGKLCEPIHPGDNAVTASKSFGTLAWTASLHTKSMTKGTVFMCIDKLKRFRRLRIKPNLRVPSFEVLVKHELAHPLVTDQHPRYWCGVMCASPVVTEITKETIKKIRKVFDPLCVKRER